MSPELSAEFELAYRPFYESQGAINAGHCRLKSWRYFLEINSACTLKCPTCTKGNMAGYDHQTGLMDLDLMERILDKIQSENPNAIVFTYGNSEPFIHPQLPECIAAIKRRGLHPEMSTNLNYVQRLDELLEAGPDLIIISLSGFTQDVYVKGHAGGNIEKVKANMRLLAAANNARAERVNILVNYHVYNDNAHEIEPMREFAEGLELGFFTSLARAISMENAIQYCRSQDPEATPFEVQAGRPDWNKVLPPVGENYVRAMERIRIKPTDARAMYAHHPMLKVCPIGQMFSFIRHDGKISLCACVADRRIELGNYLEKTQDELMAERVGHAVCQQCLKYRQSYYFHIVDQTKWTP